MTKEQLEESLRRGQPRPGDDHLKTQEAKALVALVEKNGGQLSEIVALAHVRGQTVDPASLKTIREAQHPPLTEAQKRDRVGAAIAALAHDQAGAGVSVDDVAKAYAGKLQGGPVLAAIRSAAYALGYSAPPVPAAEQPGGTYGDPAKLQSRPTDALPARPIDAARTPIPQAQIDAAKATLT